MNQPCDCCLGPHVVTPAPTGNRPGLRSLRYRVGAYSDFFQTMQARLSSSDYAALAALRTREKSDLSIALLDAWAVLGDVLTFYQERIATEGYLRTATERRSVLELARLIGYGLRPGVSSSVFLAYTLEKGSAPVQIPVGTRSNTIPGPGEQVQAFETADPLEAREEWNTLRPRQTRPQTPQSVSERGLFLKGINLNLKANDPLLIDFGGGPELYRAASVEVDAAKERTRVWPAAVKTPAVAAPAVDRRGPGAPEINVLEDLTNRLSVAASLTPPSPRQLVRSIDTTFAKASDTTPKLLATLRPELRDGLYAAWQNVPPRTEPKITVQALRVAAAPFGHNAPLRLFDYTSDHKLPVMKEWEIDDPWNRNVAEHPRGGNPAVLATERPEQHTATRLYLDADYDIAPDSLIVIEEPHQTIITRAGKDGIVHGSLVAYGLSGKTTLINLPDNKKWLPDGPTYALVRQTRVYAHGETLELAEEPINDDIDGAIIELDGLYAGLEAGRWLIVTGERTDITDAKGKPIPGVRAAELAMLAGVSQRVATAPPATTPGSELRASAEPEALPGDKVHTFIQIANLSVDGKAGLAYSYKRDSVTIYGNVGRATNGETRNEVLGAGDASQAMQRFPLKQPPLTYLSAPTVSGVRSTLEVRVNDLLWHEAESLTELGPRDRKYVTRTDDDGKTTVIFGNGTFGARLPTGIENVKATYRNGIGKPGNVKAEQISLVVTRPLGVKSVINPIRASGGAHRDTRDEARTLAPLSVTALNRLVSRQDYEDFAKIFAGIGKAAAIELPGFGRTIHVTVAGKEDAPIEVSSDLLRNLRDALELYGDPHLRLQVGVRERLAIVLSARVRLAPDYSWELEEPKIRAALLEAFSFQNRELAQDALLAVAMTVIQRRPGVDYVDVDVFDAISEGDATANFTKERAAKLKPHDRIPVLPARSTAPHQIAPAQIAYLVPEVPETLILQEMKA